MEDVQGRTLFDEETVQVLPAYMKAGVVLMPGQTLPLVLHDQSEIDMMKTALDEEKTLAILHHEYVLLFTSIYLVVDLHDTVGVGI